MAILTSLDNVLVMKNTLEIKFFYMYVNDPADTMAILMFFDNVYPKVVQLAKIREISLVEI